LDKRQWSGDGHLIQEEQIVSAMWFNNTLLRGTGTSQPFAVSWKTERSAQTPDVEKPVLDCGEEKTGISTWENCDRIRCCEKRQSGDCCICSFCTPNTYSKSGVSSPQISNTSESVLMLCWTMSRLSLPFFRQRSFWWEKFWQRGHGKFSQSSWYYPIRTQKSSSELMHGQVLLANVW
jgi:hypothetical protein